MKSPIANRSNEANLRRIGKPRAHSAAALAMVLMVVFSVPALAQRTGLKPGFNLFTPQQDIDVGRQNSQQAERQLNMLNSPRVDNYLNALGHRLDAHVPPGTPNYPFQYKCVNDMAINAFALPGGFIYINRGVIESADTEAQLAGVMAHETSHVVLRHGTNQATKAYIAQGGLGLLGALMGGNSIGGMITQLGASFSMESIFLKMSRTDESQADILGTQILYDTGYDPRAMAQFFEKIQAQSKGHPIQFFSDHPNPENRIGRVDEEVQKLGGPPANYKSDSAEFQEIKRYVHSLPAPPKAGQRPVAANAGGSSAPPANPSSQTIQFQNNRLSFYYPSNWQAYGSGDSVTFAPQNGVLADAQGNDALAYGVIMAVYQPKNGQRGISLQSATDTLIRELQSSNSQMRIARKREAVRLGGQPALSTYLTNISPAGGAETDWLVTVMQSDGVLYFICVAPQSAYDSYSRTFENVLSSVHLR